jgi:hypothetical protein
MAKPKKTLTAEEVAHAKFLKKMGVTKKDLKSRKEARIKDASEQSQFKPDTRTTVFNSYDD